jgi:hypothetical protein
MMKKIILLFLSLVVITITSCEKENAHKVSYMVSSSVAGFNVSYLDNSGELQSMHITTQSANDKKNLCTWYGNEGDIVYISVTDTAASSYVKVKIFVDDKVYKEATRTNVATMPVTVSGCIPYDK